MLRSPEPKQLEEWLEGQTTRWFLHLLRVQLDVTFNRRAEVFFPGEPNKTQETKAHLIGQEAILQDLIECFETQDFSDLESESDQHIRHPSVRGPSPHQAG